MIVPTVRAVRRGRRPACTDVRDGKWELTEGSSGAGPSGDGEEAAEGQQVGPPPRALVMRRKPLEAPFGAGARGSFSIWAKLMTSTRNRLVDESRICAADVPKACRDLREARAWAPALILAVTILVAQPLPQDTVHTPLPSAPQTQHSHSPSRPGDPIAVGIGLPEDGKAKLKHSTQESTVKCFYTCYILKQSHYFCIPLFEKSFP